MDEKEATTHLTDVIRQLTGNASLTESTDLIDAGVIDSLTMMDLVAAIQSAYGVRLAVNELTPKNFQTITSIVETIVRNQSAS